MTEEGNIQKTTVYIQRDLYDRAMVLAAQRRIYAFSHMAVLAIEQWVKAQEKESENVKEQS
jgi:hypothetical protein